MHVCKKSTLIYGIDRWGGDEVRVLKVSVIGRSCTDEGRTTQTSNAAATFPRNRGK